MTKTEILLMAYQESLLLAINRLFMVKQEIAMKVYS